MNKLNKQGQREGLWKQYYDNGQLWIESNYIDGKLNGLYKHYRGNGKLWYQCNYIDNERNGLYKEYYDNGQLKSKGDFSMKKGYGNGIMNQVN